LNEVYKLHAAYAFTHWVPLYLQEDLWATQLIEFGVVTLSLHYLLSHVVNALFSNQQFSPESVTAILHADYTKLV